MPTHPRMYDGANSGPSAAGALDEDRYSLPAWIYRDPEFLDVERETIFAPSWQIVCHLSDIPNEGDYHTLDFLGETVFVVRAAHNEVHGFFNVCRHRAARLLDGSSGHCGSRIVCPYHAWTYATDGTLVGLPERQEFSHMDMRKNRLAPVEVEVWRGFVFMRITGSGPTVAEMMAPYDSEIAQYRFEDVQPLGRVTLRERAVNWKNVGDNYSDALHIRVAHPGLTRLFGKSYGVASNGYVDKMWGQLEDEPSRNASERMYQAVLPPVAHLPPERQRMWTYYKLWPNIAFDVYPDQIDFMQSIPISPTKTVIREIAYVLPDARREMRAARYLNWRINRRVSIEDKDLIERVQHGMASRSYTVGALGDSEVSLKSFGRRMRALIPACRQAQAPSAGWSRDGK